MRKPSEIHTSVTKEWSDEKKWKRDLWKSAITFTIGTVITILVFVFFLDRKQYQWQSEYGLRIQVLRDYERSSSLYTLWAYDAFKDAYFGEERDSSVDIKNWQDEGYDNFSIAQRSLEFWFKTNRYAQPCKNIIDSNILNGVDAQKKKLRNEFKELLNSKRFFVKEEDREKKESNMKWTIYQNNTLNNILDSLNYFNKEILLKANKQLENL